MKKLTPEEVYETDLNAQYLGISTSKLMENAGKAVAEEIKKRTKKKSVLVIAGRGNNGGDAFVTARHLWNMGYNVKVALLTRESLIKSEVALKNYQILKNLPGITSFCVKDSAYLDKLEQEITTVDIIVDGILGIGIKGSARGLPAEAIKTINQFKSSKKIFSIDVPSGLDVRAGKAKEPYIQADVIITFSNMKNGLSTVEGNCIVRKIGIPPEASTYVGPGDILVTLTERDLWAHKGDFGNVLVIGGSKDFSGAPALSALSCLKSGTDIVVIAAPESVSSTVRTFAPDLIVSPFSGDYFSMNVAKNLEQELKKYDAVILGPGLGERKNVFNAVSYIVKKIAGQGIPLVIDADALKAFKSQDIPSNEVILTPHAGEFKILFDEIPPRPLDERGNRVRHHAEKENVTILLKGHVDVISNGRSLKFNNTGNPGMTVGGTGDVLTGIVGSLLGRGVSLFKAASIGAFVSGKAGDKAFTKLGEGLTASDVIEEIPEIFRWVKEFGE